MEKELEFVLPARWKLKVTNENMEFLSKWRKDGSIGSMAYGEVSPSGYIIDDSGWWTTESSNTEITYGEFRKYILKEKNKPIQIW